ncbi:hypothetical protein O181_036431 [Austropuccinia psidii MF-1]|uniref:Uncharacterized protein n=1 Tax=Austropuccinia psidii MF-1 TaxID=1389203 RepID=A0A9Q3DA69_9BASI|nr:hypothetical protein [Austropuccinia psidii MF-1]
MNPKNFTPEPQSNKNTDHSITLTPELLLELQQNLSQKDEIISCLSKKVESMEFSLHRKEKKVTPVDETKSESYENKLKTALTSSIKNKKNKNSKKAKNLHSKAKSSKESPIQMVKNDHPTGFEKKNMVPAPPKPEQLKEFYQRFSNADQIETAIENDGPILVPIDTIETVRKAREKNIKIGKNFLYLPDFLIRYVHNALAKLGIRNRSPNLYEQPDLLYNEACQINALQTFRQLAIGGSFQFMSINITYLDDLELLTQTYDHYVHYYWYSIFHKEQKDSGSHHHTKERKAIQGDCQKVSLQINHEE